MASAKLCEMTFTDGLELLTVPHNYISVGEEQERSSCPFPTGSLQQSLALAILVREMVRTLSVLGFYTNQINRMGISSYEIPFKISGIRWRSCL